MGPVAQAVTRGEVGGAAAGGVDAGLDQHADLGLARRRQSLAGGHEARAAEPGTHQTRSQAGPPKAPRSQMLAAPGGTGNKAPG